MNDAEHIEVFRKALLRQAYQDFLAWAWAKDEIVSEWLTRVEDCKDKGEACPTFIAWVTNEYWGEVE